MSRNRHRIRQFHPPVTGMLTATEVARLTMPIHTAIALLPTGLYTEEHAHDLAAFLTVAQVAARNTNRADIVAAGSKGAAALIRMRDRAKAGKPWGATTGERLDIMLAVTAIDGWFHTLRKAQWLNALREVYRMCDEASDRGLQELDLIVESV